MVPRLIGYYHRLAGNPLIRRVVKNSAYLFSASGIVVVLGFFQNLLVTNLLGVALFGILGGIVKFTSVVNKLASFRINELVVKYVGHYHETNDLPRAAAIFRFSVLVEILSSLLSYGLILLLAPLGARYLAKDLAFGELFALYGLIVLGNVMFESGSGLLQILDRFRPIAVLQAVQSLVTLIWIAVAYAGGGGLSQVVLAYMAGKFLSGAGIAVLALVEAGRRWGPGWQRQPLSLLRGEWRAILRFVFSTNLSATINLVNKDSEELWVLLLRNPVEAGYYKQAIALANLVLIPIAPLPQATYPELAREASRRAWANVRYILKQGSRLAFVYTAGAAAVLVLFGRPLIERLYTAEFLPAYPALLILLAGLLVANTFYWNRTALLALDRPDYPTWVNAGAAIVKTILVFLLVPVFGYLASGALLSSYYLVSIGLNVRKVYRELDRQTGIAVAT